LLDDDLFSSRTRSSNPTRERPERGRGTQTTTSLPVLHGRILRALTLEIRGTRRLGVASRVVTRRRRTRAVRRKVSELVS